MVYTPQNPKTPKPQNPIGRLNFEIDWESRRLKVHEICKRESLAAIGSFLMSHEVENLSYEQQAKFPQKERTVYQEDETLESLASSGMS